jgi:hypothetical protein
MNIMADMTAAMAEQSFHSGGVQEITPLTPVQMSWWKTFKLVYSSPVWYSFSPVSSPFYDTLEFSRLSSPCAASLARDFIHPAFVADAVKGFWINRQRSHVIERRVRHLAYGYDDSSHLYSFRCNLFSFSAVAGFLTLSRLHLHA